MTVTITELYKSREGVESLDNPSAVHLYMITGTDDDVAVRSTIESNVPASYVGLPVQDYDFRPLGNQIWEATVHYGLKKQTNESSFSFDTGGGSQHITQSRGTIGAYGAPGVIPPNFKGAIGVTQDSVEGVDVTVPVYNFSETHYVPAAAVTPAYKASLFYLTGTVNNALFRGFAAGEVLFLGASGSSRGNNDWEIAFRFAASPNVAGLVVGDISGIVKRGWEYLWVRYAEAEDTAAKVLVKRPLAAYVEQVYPYADFTALGIGA